MYELLKKSCIELASVCDGAIGKDGMGFNKPDSSIGQALAYSEKWLKVDAINAYEMLRKYTKQLKGFGINYKNIEDPQKNDKSDFKLDNGTFSIDNLKELFENVEETTEKNIRGINYLIKTIKIPRGFWDLWKAQKKEMYKDFYLDYPAYTISLKVKKLSKDLTMEDLRIIFMNKYPTYVRKFDKYVRSASMHPQFWTLWNSQKSELKAQGFGCGKDRETGEWQMTMWTKTQEILSEEEILEEEAKFAEEEAEKEEFVQEQLSQISFDDTNLYDYQKPHAMILYKSLLKNGVAVDNSETGTGKTFTALNVIKRMGKKVFAICPKSVIPGWIRSMETIGIEGHVVNYETAKTGKYYSRTINKKGKLVIKRINCPFISCEKNLEKKTKFDPKWLLKWDLPEDYVLVWDEAHRCKNKSINSQLMIEATNAKITQLLLSATIAENPLKMVGSGKALGLYNEPWEFYTQFAVKYDCSKEQVSRYATAWQFNGDQNTMKRLHADIGDKMDGMKTDELRKKGLFPETLIIAENYEMNGNAKKIQKIYEKYAEKLQNIVSGKNDAEMEKEMSVEGAALKYRQKCRQEVELLKIPTLKEMAEDHIEQGNSVVIFVNFTDTLIELCNVLKTDCTIYGKNTSAQNEANRQRFEDNESRIIICNVAAAKEGIDLHDIHHKYERVSLVTPSDSAQDLKQALGRIDRAGGTASIQKIVFCANTIEEQVCNNVRAKIENIDALNDGDVEISALF